MDKRKLLLRIAKGEDYVPAMMRMYFVCNGERRLLEEKETDAPVSITISVHCNDMKQLELQA